MRASPVIFAYLRLLPADTAGYEKLFFLAKKSDFNLHLWPVFFWECSPLADGCGQLRSVLHMANVKRFAFGPMDKKGLLSQFKALASS